MGGTGSPGKAGAGPGDGSAVHGGTRYTAMGGAALVLSSTEHPDVACPKLT